MRNKILSIIAVAGCMAVSAQETCIITGSLADNQLADGKKVKKVYLTRTNEFGVATTVATAKVKKDGYTFKYKLTPDEPVMQYTITGFGDSVREVVAFPANQRGQDLLMGSPNEVTEQQLRDVHIQVRKKN